MSEKSIGTMRWVHCLIALTCLAGSGVAVAQDQPVSVDRVFSTQTEQYRPSWGLIPEVQSPSFNYSAVQPGKLVAESSERLDYLSISNLIVGNTDGYQVVGPDGELFFVDDITRPNCSVQIIGQQVERGGVTSLIIPETQLNGFSSFVSIDRIEFDGCR